MAPVKISYVVSSSQDPKYPAENLLSEDGVRPWLGCPKKHSRQLSVELQLERASPIGYIDIGNYGCAFVQIEVGRSSWTCDQPYLTLVPTVTLMTPADSKLDQNRYGVQMFKEGCFLLDLLPMHASQCGEDPTTAWPFLSPDAWVSCPICQLPFRVTEVEQHASNCGETPGALSSP
ncbi:protein XNDC1N-like [Cinclus cinclus]|uniref:protein XNDC1N-like n=1 Tax=Cinclus cinclus TaxID=127875 RepID=UPI002E0EEF4D